MLGVIIAGFLLSGGENGNQNSAAVGDAPAAGDSDIDATADQRFWLKGLRVRECLQSEAFSNILPH